ncbi:MAG: protein kinase [Planctomycetaceae bacterium]|nr:protein kinase [Planctomycetaceae bacterium]
MSEPESTELGRLLDEFISRYRRGEHPGISEFARRYPQHADEIYSILPTLVALERVSPDGESGSGRDQITQDGAVLRQLGDFRIIREIGRGGMGIVYEAEQESLGRHVALKVLPYCAVLDRQQLDRFRREVRAAAQLHHSNIVPVFAVGEEKGIHYYAMQYIRGQSLDEVLQELNRMKPGPRQGPSTGSIHQSGAMSAILSVCRESTGMPRARVQSGISGWQSDRRAPEESQEGTLRRDAAARAVAADPLSTDEQTADHQAADRQAADTGASSETESSLGSGGASYFRSIAGLCRQVAEAIDYAHSRGVLHRDIKPSNILLDGMGTAWVTDFGLARTDGDDLTHTGDLVGTLRYMSPERFRGWSDPRSDVYSLGLTLYELATLRPAFPGTDRASLIRMVCHGQPPAPRRVTPEIPRTLETIIQKAISREPESRYQTAGQMAEDLLSFMQDRPIRARRPTSIERSLLWLRRNPLVASLVGFIFVLMTVLTVVSTVAAFRLEVTNQQVETALEQVSDAEQEQRAANDRAVQSLFEAYVAQARAERYGGRPGRHFNSLAAIRQASALRDRLSLDEVQVRELRNEAIACLALDDLEVDVELDDDNPVAHSHHKWAFDSTNERMARVETDGTVSIIRVDNGEHLQSLSGAWMIEAGLPYLRFSPDDRFLAVKGMVDHGRAALEVWDLNPLSCILTDNSVGAKDWSRDVEFTPDSRFVSWMDHHDFVVCSVPDGTEVRRRPLSNAPDSYCFCPLGDHVAMLWGNSFAVVAWKEDAEPVVVDTGSQVNDVDWSPRGDLIAAASYDGSIRIWNTTDLQAEPRRLVGHRSQPRYVQFSPRGDLLASWSWDATTRLWQPFLGRELLQWTGYRVSRFSGDGSGLSFESPGGKTGRWNVAGGTWCRTLSCGQEYSGVSSADFHPDGDLIAMQSRTGVKVIRWPDGLELASLKPYSENMCCRFSRNGQWLITSGTSSVDRWDVGQIRDPIQSPQPEPVVQEDAVRMPLDFAVDAAESQLIASCSRGAKLYQLDENLATIEHTFLEGDPQSWFVALSPDGRWSVISGKHFTGVIVIDNNTHREVFRSEDAMPGRVFFRPDSQQMVISREQFQVFETGTWRLITEIPRLLAGVGSVAWSPDGSTLALQDLMAVRLLRASTFDPLAELTGPYEEQLSLGYPEGACALRFSHDGRYLLSGTTQGTLHVWDLLAVRDTLNEMQLDWVNPDETSRPRMMPSRLPVSAALSQTVIQPLFPHSIARARTAAELFQERLDAVSRRVQESPEDFTALEQRMQLLRQDRQYAAAVDDLSRLIEHLPDRTDLLELRAHLYDQLQREDLAIRDLQAVLAVSPDQPSAANSLAWHLASTEHPLRDPETAVTLASKAVAADPENSTYVNTLGVALFRAGQHESALHLLEQNAGRTDNTAPAFDWFFVSLCHAKLGHPVEARHAWHRAMDWWQHARDLDPGWHMELKALAAEAARELPHDD